MIGDGKEQSGNGLLTALSTEGSLSDSGISDSGSEQELNEREKRLAQLKRLAKRLESILVPSSQALSNMFNVSCPNGFFSFFSNLSKKNIN